MIFLFEMIYILKELVWNIISHLTRDNEEGIRLEEQLFSTGKSTVRAKSNQND